MKLYLKGFQKKWEDTIAVIYRLGKYRTAIKPKQNMYYDLNEDSEYLIVCGLQEFRVKDGIITRSFCSNRHPFVSLDL